MTDRKVAIVTGGARGIGRGTARCLAEAGADVVLADLRPEGAADEAAAAVQAFGRRALVKRVDVADRAQVEQLVAETIRELGRLGVEEVSTAYLNGRFEQMERVRDVIVPALAGAAG